MRNLFLLAELAKACNDLAYVANDEMVDGSVTSKDWVTNTAKILASIDLISEEYDINKDEVLPLLLARKIELDRWADDQSSQDSSQSEDDDTGLEEEAT